MVRLMLARVLRPLIASRAAARLVSTVPSSAEPNSEALFTSEHRAMQESLQKLIDSEINPHVDKWEADKSFPAHDVFKKLGSAGFLGVNKPTEYGGLGLDFTYSIALAEQLGTVRCGAIPMAIGVQSDMTTPALAKFGSKELKEEFLAPTIAGDKVACLGVSEVGSGSDVSSIRTTAHVHGDEFVINGGKMWTTNGLQADWMCLLANTSAENGPHMNKSLICLPMDTPGIHRQRNIAKIGMFASDTAEIVFEDVRVPRRNLIGQAGQGFVYQMLQFQEERMWAAANSLLPMETCIQETVEYTKTRKAFGQPIIANQAVHFRLAELQTEVEALRALLYRTVSKYVAGEDTLMLASMCKLKAGRLAREVTDSCLQFWGGMGYTADVYVSRVYRDMRLLSIGGGADEVMLAIIAKTMGALPKPKK